MQHHLLLHRSVGAVVINTPTTKSVSVLAHTEEQWWQGPVAQTDILNFPWLLIDSKCLEYAFSGMSLPYSPAFYHLPESSY